LIFPYTDRAGLARRAKVPSQLLAELEGTYPGFIDETIADRSSYIEGRLRKRYGNKAGNLFGGVAPPFAAYGTAPPPIAIQGIPQLGSLELVIKITQAGALGTAQCSISGDGGRTQLATGVVTGPAVTILGTGLVAAFAGNAGPYSVDNLYKAATPVPRIVLMWLATMVAYDCYDKRGADPQEPTFARRTKEYERTEEQLKEAADSKDGLYDLPATDGSDTAVVTGGPLGTSEESPYTWQRRQAISGTAEDRGFRESPKIL
jgi:hypothetical protein